MNAESSIVHALMSAGYSYKNAVSIANSTATIRRRAVSRQQQQEMVLAHAEVWANEYIRRTRPAGINRF